MKTGSGAFPERKAGFTILELIAVIGIVAVMATIVSGGFGGMIQSLSRRNASDGLRRAIQLARQEACVKGHDTYVYPVDVDKFVIVSAAGTITSAPTGSKKPSYHYKASVNGEWVVDAYADLSSAAETFSNNTSNQDNKKSLNDYAGGMVFDLTKGVSADIEYPPWHDEATDQWMFGVKDRNGGFKAGNSYGWVSYPVQKLPEGWVFEGLYNSAGEFDSSKAQKQAVHFEPSGKAQDQTFTLKNVASDETIKVSVTSAGKVKEQ